MHEGRTGRPASPPPLEAKTLHSIQDGSTFHCLICSSWAPNMIIWRIVLNIKPRTIPIHCLGTPTHISDQKTREVNKRILVIQVHFLLKEILMFSAKRWKQINLVFSPLLSSPADYHPCLPSFLVIDSSQPERLISRWFPPADVECWFRSCMFRQCWGLNGGWGYSPDLNWQWF